MSRLTISILLPLLFCVGCNDTPTNPFQLIDEPLPDPIGIAENTVYVGAEDGSADVYVYNNTSDTLDWDIRFSAESSADWIDLLPTGESILPYDSTLLSIWVEREDIEPGIVNGEVQLSYDGEAVQTIVVVVQVGTPKWKPIGVANNFIRVPANQTDADIDLFNNSQVSWATPASWQGRIEITVPWIPTFGVSQYEVEPGWPASFVALIDREGLTHGTYIGQLLLYWEEELVQTIHIEMVVGE
jgi:hypothetical protein